MAKLPTRRTIFDLVGEAQNNEDGVNRQIELKRSVPGSLVRLVRDSHNRFDANAVKVISDRGVCIGYLGRDDAADLNGHLADGRHHAAHIHELRGGMPDYPNIGCKIAIVWDGRPLPAAKPVAPEQTLIGAQTPLTTAMLNRLGKWLDRRVK
jgi:hypothetical protein